MATSISKQLINQLVAIRKTVVTIPHTTITEKLSVTLLEKCNGYSIVVHDKLEWMRLMRQLHEIYWAWINPRGISFSYGKFADLCCNLWKQVYQLGIYIDYKLIYRKYKSFESKIPRAHGIIRNSQDLNKILLVRHHNDYLWSLPGGKLENGETHDDAVLRELYEEVNFISDKNTKWIGSPKFRGLNACYHIIITPHSKPKTNCPFEIAEVKWFSLQNMPQNTKLLRRYLGIYDILWKYKNK